MTYAQWAPVYWRKGWRAPLPVPPRAKEPPPKGYTGAGGLWPSYPDVQAWTEDHPDHNIALRLQPGFVGLDVDAYGAKLGGPTLAGLEQRLGALPPTWISTSRTDGTSGIRLYRSPAGVVFRGEAGPGIEVVQPRHRYIVVSGSIHPEGRAYRWRSPGGEWTDEPPHVDLIPVLPAAWVEGLGRPAGDEVVKASGPVDVVPWFRTAANSADPCGAVRTTVMHARDDLAAGVSSRHDIGVRITLRLLYMSHEGHTGVAHALEQVRAAWHEAVTVGSSMRSQSEADREWRAMIDGAFAILGGDGAIGDPGVPDPCSRPLAGILLDSYDEPGGAIEAALPSHPVDLQGIVGPGEGVSPAAAADADEAFATLVAREKILQRVRRTARRMLDAEEAIAGWAPPDYTDDLAAELALPDDEVRWRVGEVFPVGANVLLTSMFKAGKTTLTNHLVKCFADGQPFLGRYPIEQPERRIVVWNYEVSAAQWRQWIREVGVQNVDRISVVHLRGHTMPLISEHVQEWTINYLKQEKAGVWIVDPFARAFVGSGESENDNTVVGQFLEILDVIKHRAGVDELILPTHTGRATSEPGTERARGATRLDDWADVRWLITKDKDGARYFRATGRDVETPEGGLQYDPLTRNLTLTEGGREESESPAGGSRGAKITDSAVQNAVLAVVDGSPGIGLASIRQQVRDRIGSIRNDRVDAAIRILAQHALVKIEDGGKGNPIRHFVPNGDLAP
jgi:hypothetical protein